MTIQSSRCILGESRRLYSESRELLVRLSLAHHELRAVIAGTREKIDEFHELIREASKQKREGSERLGGGY